jgi:hypothetical protein
VSTTVHLPRILAEHVGQRHVELQPATLADALSELSSRFALDDGLLDHDRLQPWIIVQVDGERIREARLDKLRGVQVADRRVEIGVRLACG